MNSRSHILRALLLPVLASLLLSLCTTAAAVTREEVIAGAEKLYRDRINEAEQKQQLDTDPVFLARLQRIAAGLIAHATLEHPFAARWNWEIHSSSDPDENAFCMAGGKLLIGREFVYRLSLDDAELAMLLSHEIQHAVLEHNLQEFQQAFRLDPAWLQQPFAALEYALDHDNALMDKLADFNFAQEMEADHEGLLMAWRSGWPAMKLANYFRKQTRANPMANFDSPDHPSASRRWLAARELAEQLEQLETEAPGTLPAAIKATETPGK